MALVHVFELKGLGKAPFQVVSVGRIMQRKGYKRGRCDYCGTLIVNLFWIESADGKRFVVGSDCVNKTGDPGLIQAVKRRKKLPREIMQW